VSLADPSATTVVYMPTKTLEQLVERAVLAGLDPATPAVAVARATQPDQQVLAAPIAELPARLAATPLGGPVTVMIGRVFAANQSNVTPDRASGASGMTATSLVVP